MDMHAELTETQAQIARIEIAAVRHVSHADRRANPKWERSPQAERPGSATCLAPGCSVTGGAVFSRLTKRARLHPLTS
jgi:hypothetical protein